MSKTPRSHDVAEAPSKHLSILSGMAHQIVTHWGLRSQEGVLAGPGDLARHGAARTNEFDAWQVTADDHKRGTPAGLWMPGRGWWRWLLRGVRGVSWSGLTSADRPSLYLDRGSAPTGIAATKERRQWRKSITVDHDLVSR